MPTTVLTIVLLMCSGTMAGGMVLVAAAVIPTFRRLPLASYVQMHSMLSHYIDRYMPAIVLLTIPVGFATMWLSVRWSALVGIGVLLTIFAAGISYFGNAPINRAIRSWDSERVPVESLQLRERWCRLHLWRTVAGFLALMVFAAAAALH